MFHIFVIVVVVVVIIIIIISVKQTSMFPERQTTKHWPKAFVLLYVAEIKENVLRSTDAVSGHQQKAKILTK